MFHESGMTELPPEERRPDESDLMMNDLSARAETGQTGAESARDKEKREQRIAELREYLTSYLELGPDKDPAGIKFEEAVSLAGEYGEQYRFLADQRLAGVEIAVVPDQLWIKGRQPSESHASKGLILIREGYYQDPAKPEQDEPAWLTHELAHCQQFMDKGEEYDKDSQRQAFENVGPGVYPNNKVEEYTFRRQFGYLRSKGVSRERVTALLREQYEPEDFDFFDKILDQVYGEK